MLGSEEILPSASQSSEKEEALRAMTDGLSRGERPAKRQRLADGISAADAGSREWAEVISVIQPAIVALKVTFVVSFEDEHAAVAMGTGFVVDKQRGLILTNRHITGVGPVRAIAMFDRHEELDAEVIYRDPVHDFGFFRYDPSKLRLTEPAEIRLAPQELQVGTEVRIVGNDAGEKLQILSGTIARVDRNVPEINAVYCDENTFYAGAGAGTSGGSSGSPVLNKQGNAIALNAAGTDGAASAFFLPLSRVKVALQRLQDGLPVMRGTCQATFLFKAFDELRRIGLLEEHEQDVRKQVVAATGMLVVDSVLCEQKQLRPGDILLLLENRHCVDFVHLEEVLDDKVGCAVDVLVCRGGVEIAMSIDVHDLHSLIPRSYVELGMDVVHGLGYHAARRSHLPLDSGIYLARSGYVFESLGCDWGSLITSVNGKPTPSPEAFAKAIEHIPDKQYFPVHWYDLRDFRRDRALKTGFAKMSRAWSPLKLWRCASPASASPEQWTSEELPVPSRPPRRPEPLGRAAILTGGDRLVRALQTSLVTVRFRTDQRFLTEALDSGSSEGVGLLVDAKRGIALTDRHSAPQSLGAIEVTLAGCATVEAEVFFIHPQHNIALLRCDPIAVEMLIKGKLPLKSARFAKGKKASLRPGESVHFVGFDSQGNAFSAKCQVSAVYLPSGKDEFPPWTVPRFRERSLEIVVLSDTPEDARGGVLCDSRGEVRALFASFDFQSARREETTDNFGIPASVFLPLLEGIKKNPNKEPEVRSLDIEVSAVDLATLARGSPKLPKPWAEAVRKRCGQQGQVARAICVCRVLSTGVSNGLLLPGDVLLSVAGRTITQALDVEEALIPKKDRPSSRKRERSEEVLIAFLRDGKEATVAVKPSILGSEDDADLVIWAGMVLRKTPRCILERCGASIAPRAGGVFVQSILNGSPAESREFAPYCFLMEMDGQPIRQLSDVLLHGQLDRNGPAHGWVRLLLLDMNGQEQVRAVQRDPLFFPTMTLHRSPQCWRCTQKG
ncbi:unnamed protein product [Symbiodinium necroappetens]|uniref:PDZ-like domain-containing protein n=1 Tax=Symbiodinium necroappetens TaxID=1628268 RepID=A0A813BE75_9DINO|nr:unnamed protein product [Symbiodinium necroappetens]